MIEYKYGIDPVRYAWEHLNPRVPFPALGVPMGLRGQNMMQENSLKWFDRWGSAVSPEAAGRMSHINTHRLDN